MGGGLMQLVAYGAQDIYLTGNPQITFFKVVYRRHTNFSMESIQQTFDGTADFGNSVSCTISRNGDLIHRMYLEHEASLKGKDTADDDNIGVCCDYGSHLMKQTDLEIGGQLIDRHYGHWHSTYSQLIEFNPSGSAYGGDKASTKTTGNLFQIMSGNGNSFETIEPGGSGWGPNPASLGGWTLTNNSSMTADEVTGKFWIPLYFWFCRNPGLALPLIALQYHEVKVKIQFESLINLALLADNASFVGETKVAADKNPSGKNSFDLWCDYIYLDTDERRRFAQVSHEYLIEQVQHQSSSGGNIELNFNHPVKELVWAGKRTTTVSEAPNLYSKDKIYSSSLSETAKLTLNGHDRFAPRDLKYFTRTQIWQHHTGYGSTQTGGDEIAVYSFALKPEEHQPSGTCNFSRIDNAQLVQSKTQPVEVYAVNYNVLRIMSGMGGLAYSN